MVRSTREEGIIVLINERFFITTLLFHIAVDFTAVQKHPWIPSFHSLLHMDSLCNICKYTSEKIMAGLLASYMLITS